MNQALSDVAEIQMNNPNIKFEKIIIRKSTYSLKGEEEAKNTLNPYPDFGRKVKCEITRNDEKTQK